MSLQPIEFDHILVPYDFSETARVALEHATKMAHKARASVTILHVKESNNAGQFADRGVNSRADGYETAVNQNLEDALLKLRILGLKCNSIVREGKIFKVVEEVVKEFNISLIVIGTHGVKGRENFFLGSNAYKIVNHLKVPVLAVQGSAANAEYRKVFLPLDETFNTREKIPYAMLIARLFDAELSIVGLLKHHDKEATHHLHAIVNQADHYVSEEVKKVSSSVVDSKNNAADTLKYAEEQDADLIVIMSEQEKTLSGLFLGPYAQQVVSAAKVPVLIVPPRVSLVMTNVSI